jgi:hypothetical protein
MLAPPAYFRLQTGQLLRIRANGAVAVLTG